MTRKPVVRGVSGELRRPLEISVGYAGRVDECGARALEHDRVLTTDTPGTVIRRAAVARWKALNGSSRGLRERQLPPRSSSQPGSTRCRAGGAPTMIAG
jgi:hypothetical protein